MKETLPVYQSLDDVVEEARRVLELAQWQHLGLLAEVAGIAFQCSMNHFSDLLDGRLTGASIGRYRKNYQFARALPKKLREATRKITVFDDARIRAKRTGEDPAVAMEHALENRWRYEMRRKVNALRSIANFCAEHKLPDTLRADVRASASRILKLTNSAWAREQKKGAA
jgi:hypothetical protein